MWLLRTAALLQRLVSRVISSVVMNMVQLSNHVDWAESDDRPV